MNIDGRAFEGVEVFATDRLGNRFGTITDRNGGFWIFRQPSGRVEGQTFEVRDPTRPMQIMLNP